MVNGHAQISPDCAPPPGWGDKLSFTSPTRKRGKSERVPRLRFGLVYGRAQSGLDCWALHGRSK
jgi:hypothetical protein